MDAFSKDLLGPCNVQVLSICHKWFQSMC
jgi:hypothetical protein